MMNMTKRVLESIGINSKRFILEWVSTAEGSRFAEVTTNFTNQLRELGPLGTGDERSREGMVLKLNAAKETCVGKRLRMILGKSSELAEGLNGDSKIDELIRDEILSNEILFLLEERSYSVKEISEKIDASSPNVLKCSGGLKRKGLIDLDSSKEILSLLIKE